MLGANFARDKAVMNDPMTSVFVYYYLTWKTCSKDPFKAIQPAAITIYFQETLYSLFEVCGEGVLWGFELFNVYNSRRNRIIGQSLKKLDASTLISAKIQEACHLQKF